MTDFFGLVETMHKKYGFFDAVDSFEREKFLKFLEFRFEKQIQEEVNEATFAIRSYRDAVVRNDIDDQKKWLREINDAIVDILVFTFGTSTFTMTREELEKSYDTVMQANLKKEVGIKPGRPNPFHMPDLIKPPGWVSPDISAFSTTLELRLNKE